MGIAGHEWKPFAPVNVDPEGRIFRKTRFDVPQDGHVQGEWMWVEVESMETDQGVLTNDSILDADLVRGTWVIFRRIPEGEPLSGCAVAVAWSPPD